MYILSPFLGQFGRVEQSLVSIEYGPFRSQTPGMYDSEQIDELRRYLLSA